MKFQMLCMMALAVQQSNQFIFLFGNLLNSLTGSNLFHTDMAPRGKVTIRKDVNGRPGPIIETVDFDDPRVMNKVRFNTHCKNKNCHNPWSSRRIDKKQQIINTNNDQSISDITEIDGENDVNINELIKRKKLQFNQNIGGDDDLSEIVLKKRKKKNKKKRKVVKQADQQDVEEEDNNVYDNQNQIILKKKKQKRIVSNNQSKKKKKKTINKRVINQSQQTGQDGDTYNIFILPKDLSYLNEEERSEGNTQEIINTLLQKLSKSSTQTKFNKLDENQLVNALSLQDYPDVVVNNQKIPKDQFIQLLKSSDIYLDGERTDAAAFLQALNKGYQIQNGGEINTVYQSNSSKKKKKKKKSNLKKVKDVLTGSKQDQSNQNEKSAEDNEDYEELEEGDEGDEQYEDDQQYEEDEGEEGDEEGDEAEEGDQGNDEADDSASNQSEGQMQTTDVTQQNNNGQQ